MSLKRRRKNSSYPEGMDNKTLEEVGEDLKGVHLVIEVMMLVEEVK